MLKNGGLYRDFEDLRIIGECPECDNTNFEDIERNNGTKRHCGRCMCEYVLNIKGFVNYKSFVKM